MTSPDGVRTAGAENRELFVELVRTGRPDLRDRLVTAYLGLAHQLARRYTNRGEPYDDLVQVASLAIVKSVDRFDPERGVEFTTFATRTVIGELKRHFRDKGWAVRAPRRVQELYLELGKMTESLSQELGRSPTVAELASATGATEEAVLEALEAGQGYRTASIDATDRNEETLAAHIGGEDISMGTVEDRQLLAPAVARLAPREQAILRLRFGLGLTQSEIAVRVGISQMHVSRLLAASLDRLRKTVRAPET
ncbi:MAG: SigB/SigF/SigG family RNA polymerase sigma factor [Acidimicrobiales bacterium]